MKKWIKLVVFAVCLAVMITPVLASAAPGTAEGIVTRIPLGDIVLHSYLAPEKAGAVTTQIIETKNKLVIVDAQFHRPYAKEVRAYINSLGKPVDRVIITHEHPDHWFGGENFADLPLYATTETIDAIAKSGDGTIAFMKKRLGDLAPDKKVVPNNVLGEGEFTIDGLKLEVIKLQNTESANAIVIALPEYRVLIAQDLVFNHLHAYLAKNEIENWINVIEHMQSRSWSFILGGHGLPGNAQLLEEMKQYLAYAKATLAESSYFASFKKAMVEKYPYYQGTSMLDISASGLFKK